MTDLSTTPETRPANGGAFLSVRDLKVHFSTSDGIVKATDRKSVV